MSYIFFNFNLRWYYSCFWLVYVIYILYICFILIQGGSIAAAWVSMRALGVDGYTSKAKQLMETTDKLKKGIAEIDVCLF